MSGIPAGPVPVGRLKPPSGSIIMDALIYDFGGYDPVLAQAGVNCLQITACPLSSNFVEAVLSITHKRMIIKEDERLSLVTDGNELVNAISRGKTAIVLGAQNAKPIEDDLNKLHVLWALGIRVLQLTYNERNYLGDGCLENNNGGLSNFGRAAIGEMNRLGMLVDLSHVGPRTAKEAIEASKDPVVFTHANPAKLTANPRNKSDDLLRAVAGGGGVIGLSSWGPICWDMQTKQKPSLDRFMEHLEYVLDLVGPDHVGIGTDSPVGVDQQAINRLVSYVGSSYYRVSGEYNQIIGTSLSDRYAGGFVGVLIFPALADALLERGYKEEEILKILGGNFARVFSSVCK